MVVRGVIERNLLETSAKRSTNLGVVMFVVRGRGRDTSEGRVGGNWRATRQ